MAHPGRQRALPRSSAAASFRLGPDLYLAHTQPGFEAIAWEEIAAKCRAAGATRQTGMRASRPAVRELARRSVPGRAGITIFTVADPRPLRLLRTVEDVFALVGYCRAPESASAAIDYLLASSRAAPYLAPALISRSHLMPGARSGHRLRYRVIARMVGEHQFHRADLKRAVERGIGQRRDHTWRLSDDDAQVEFWATMLGDEFILAVRLTDARMRHREYKTVHLPGSLRPSVAAALGWLSAPTSQDIVLDPLCGAGTILIERAHLARYRLLIGGDRAAEALAAARQNIGPRYKPVELSSWDATAIPLPDGSVNRIITNLPWGIGHGSHHENRRVYPRILAEFRRLLVPDGRVVILTGEISLMSELMERGLCRADIMLRVSILGAAAAVYVWNRGLTTL